MISSLRRRNPTRIPTQTRPKSTGGAKPKKKLYHRVHDLDRAMDLQKKPSLILQLKSVLQSQKTHSILLRDLEKEVGFVQKWNLMAVIEKYPSLFHATGGSNGLPVRVRFSEIAMRVLSEESEVWKEMEMVLVRNLRKLLMLCVSCRVAMEKVDMIRDELGLPGGYREELVEKYGEWFCVREFKGKEYLHLENWDSGLAVTAREERLARDGCDGGGRRARISKDGNYDGPYSFRIRYPAGFRPNASFLEGLERWQRLEFPSPYLNARRFEAADPKARKRVIGVLHEVLSLTMHRRMTSDQLDAFHSELFLPSRLLLCLVKHPGIFYITNKGARSTVFLKEAYDGPNLIEKCPLLRFYDKLMALTGRKDTTFSIGNNSKLTI